MATTWLRGLEAYWVSFPPADDAARIKEAMSLMRADPAGLVWVEAEQKRPEDDADRITTWAKFRDEVIKRFQPGDVERIVRSSMRALAVKGSSRVISVADFATKFSTLAYTLPQGHMHEQDKIEYYYSGLPKNVRMAVTKGRPASLGAAINLAIDADNALKAHILPAVLQQQQGVIDQLVDGSVADNADDSTHVRP